MEHLTSRALWHSTAMRKQAATVSQLGACCFGIHSRQDERLLLLFYPIDETGTKTSRGYEGQATECVSKSGLYRIMLYII